MTLADDFSLKSWLRTLRYSVEYYEDTCETTNNRECVKNNRVLGNMSIGEKGKEESGDGLYANVWECSGSLVSEKAFENSLESADNSSIASNYEELSYTSRRSSCTGSYRTPLQGTPVPEYTDNKITKITDLDDEINVSSEPIYENLDKYNKPIAENIYENLPFKKQCTHSNNSTEFEEEIHSTIQYLENVLDSVGSSSDDDYEDNLTEDFCETHILEDDSSVNFDIDDLCEQENNIEEEKFTESSSSFGDYLRGEQISKPESLNQRFAKENRFKTFNEEEPEPISPQEVKSIPLPKKSNIKSLQRFSFPADNQREIVIRPQSFPIFYKQIPKNNRSVIEAEIDIDNEDDDIFIIQKRSNSRVNDINLSFAKESRVSTIFEEKTEELYHFEVAEEKIFGNDLILRLKENAINWMTLLMEECLEEQNNIMEEKEILKSLNQVPETSTPPLNKFPVGNDNVTLRRDPTCRNRKSKTEDFDRVKGQNFTWNHQSIEIRGVLKIQSTDGVNQIVKHGTEYILYKDDTLWMKNEKKHQQICLKSGVIINDVYYRPKESKEVSFTTNKGITFTLQFSSSKDAKQFFENCNIRRYIPDKNRPVVTDNKSTVRNMLLKFLRKRKSQEFLEQKGIYKNEPIFGNTLREIHEITRKPVPEFISNIIELIEKPENIKSLGLYRTSGNLATIQKIRLDVDNGNLKVLNQFSKDPDVLTGSLKLFLRELKEPLIPWEVYDKLSDLSKVDLKQLTSKDHQKVKTTLTKHLHEANLETFYVIIRHLVEVVKYKEFNKMDSYNLAVCWGPSIMPSLNSMSTLECTKDIVSQSHNAARLVNFLIDYYEMYPSALNRRTESMSEKFSSLKRQESKDSVESGDSSTRSYKKSNSSTSLSVDIVIKTAIDFIETYWSNDNGDGLYKKRGNSDKTNKILKRLNKKKSNELIKYKNDVNEVAGALKKYLTDCQEQLVDRTTVEILAMTYDNTINSPEQMAREDVLTHLERSPKKDSLLYLLRHFAKVVNHPDIYHISKNELIELWTKILNHDYRIHPSDQKFSKFLTVAIEVCNLPDVVRSSFNNNGNTQNRNMAEVLKDLKNHQQERDRGSRYDNIDCGVAGEASVLNNSEQTKL